MITDHRERAQWIPGARAPWKCYRQWQREGQCSLGIWHPDSEVLPFQVLQGDRFLLILKVIFSEGTKEITERRSEDCFFNFVEGNGVSFFHTLLLGVCGGRAWRARACARLPLSLLPGGEQVCNTCDVAILSCTVRTSLRPCSLLIGVSTWASPTTQPPMGAKPHSPHR